MKDYRNDNPEFSDTIKIIEETDTNHADNVNAATRQLLQNTTSLKADESTMNAMFSEQIGEAMKTVAETDNQIAALKDMNLQMAMALAAISDADSIDADNVLIETFRDENDIIITSGMFDSENHCLYA
jgi:hypothetical protein